VPARFLPRSSFHETAPTAGRDTSVEVLGPEAAPLTLRADLGARMLIVQRGDSTLKTFAVAVGQDGYPTPVGTFAISKIVWNPRLASAA